jgi:hypothetical protein
MPSAMEDPHVVLHGPRPREPFPLTAYNVELSSGSTGRLIPVHDPSLVSRSLIRYLSQEMNNEVDAALKKSLKDLVD